MSYNVEAQNEDERNLAKRSRFHQAEMDVKALKPGEKFEDLRPAYVIFICTFDNPVGHCLSAQMDALPVNLLLLPVQRTSHNKLLGHDIGNGFRCGKAAGDDILLSGYLYNGSLNVFFITVPAGIGIIHMLFHNGLGGDDL